MMSDMLSEKELDVKLAQIAHQMKEQFNSFNHNLSMGYDSLMVCADRKVMRLRREWDKTLLLQGITCENKDCKKTTSLARWKFLCGTDQDRLIETSKMKCPCCDVTVPTKGHSMSARIIWLVQHAYALPEEFLPHFEIRDTRSLCHIDED